MATPPSFRAPTPSGANSGTGGANSTATNSIPIPTDAIVGKDYMLVMADFTSTGDVGPALVNAGWSPLSPTLYGASGSLASRAFIKQIAAGDPGSSFSVDVAASGRWVDSYACITGASGYQVVAPTAVVDDTTSVQIPAFTPPANDCFVIALFGARTPANSTAALAWPAISGWTKGDDEWTQNTTSGQRLGSALYSKTYAGSGGGVQQAPAAVTSAQQVRYVPYVVVFSPQTATPVASAGTGQTVRSYSTNVLSGSQSGGSGSYTTQAWSQVSGPSVGTITSTGPGTAKFTAPPLLADGTVVFKYTVTDSSGNSASANVTWTIKKTLGRFVQGTTVKALKFHMTTPIVGSAANALFNSPIPGGGGQGCVAVDPADDNSVAVTTDTGGTRISHDATRTGYANLTGLNAVRAKQGNGVVWSTVTSSMLFMTCGDGTAGVGGVCWSMAGDQSSATPWVFLDGTVSGAPKLIFNGGNNNAPASGAPIDPDSKTTTTLSGSATINTSASTITVASTTGFDSSGILVIGSSPLGVRYTGKTSTTFTGVTASSFAAGTWASGTTVAQATSAVYPRQYGTIMERDDVSLSGFTLLHVATATNGAWRLKVRMSDMACVEQVKYPNTSGFVRSMRLARYGPNSSFGTRARLIINEYDGTDGQKPLLCTNANVSDGTTLATTTISGLPVNVENIAFCASPEAGSVPVAIIVTEYGAYLSSNLHSAAAGAISAQQITGGPENSQWWISAGATHTPGKHVLFAGCRNGGVKTSYRDANNVQQFKWNTVWRAEIPIASTNPIADAVWTPLAGPDYWSEQVMNKPGADNLFWLAGINTPGLIGTATVSHFATSQINPLRMYLTAKGNTYISDDAGKHWYASNVPSSADVNSIAFSPGSAHPNWVAMACGDWPLVAATDAPGVASFTAQPQAVIKFSKAAANGVFWDPITEEIFIGGTNAGGHSVPDANAGNTLWFMQPLDLQNSYDSLTGIGDLYVTTLNTSSTGLVGGLHGDGAVVYGVGVTTKAKRAVLYPAKGGEGLMWSNTTTVAKPAVPTWNVVSAVSAISGGLQPFQQQNKQYEGCDVVVVRSKAMVFFMERQSGIIWRVSVDANGNVSSASCIYRQSWNAYIVAPDAMGYIDFDETTNTLWFSVPTGVGYIANADTAPHGTTATFTSNATMTAFSSNFPNELCGPMALVASTSGGAPYRLAVATMYYAPGAVPIYPVNGSDGARFLVVTNPTQDASWARSAVEDWSVSRDRGYRLGYVNPKTITTNQTRSIVALSQQGSGFRFWTVNP